MVDALVLEGMIESIIRQCDFDIVEQAKRVPIQAAGNTESIESSLALTCVDNGREASNFTQF